MTVHPLFPAMVLLNFGASSLQAQSAETGDALVAPWLGASFSWGSVGVQPRSSSSGPSGELSVGISMRPRWRVGVRTQFWSALTFDGISWRAQTVKAVGSYRTESGIGFTGGVGRARIWDADGRGSVRAVVMETGIEFVVPRESLLGFRFFAARDWALTKSDVRGNREFGSLYQFHAGIGLLLH